MSIPEEPKLPKLPIGFQSMVIHESHLLTELGPERPVQRTWTERWLSRPWRPWQATKLVRVQEPMRDFIELDGRLYGHPETVRKLKSAMKERFNEDT